MLISDKEKNLIRKIYYGIKSGIDKESIEYAVRNRLIHKISNHRFSGEKIAYISRLRADLNIVRKKFNQNKIPYKILNPPDGVSEDVNILLKNSTGKKQAGQILFCLGYAPVIRSMYKIMYYRLIKNREPLKIHIHTDIAWHDVIYFDKNKLFGEPGAGIEPGPEWQIAYIIAHTFFEHQKFRLAYIFQCIEIIIRNNIDMVKLLEISNKHRYAVVFFAGFLHVFMRRVFGDILNKHDQRFSSFFSIINSGYDNFKTTADTNRYCFPYQIPGNILFKGKINKTTKDFIYNPLTAFHTASVFFAKNPVRKFQGIIRRVFMERCIIVLSGLDGTGKTTQAHMLINKFRKNKIHYLYFRYMHRGIFNKITCKLAGCLKKYPFTRRNAGLFISKIWALAALADYPIALFFRVLIPYIFKKRLIIDRYVIDNIIDLEAVLPFFRHLRNFFFLLPPRATITFLLETNKKIITGRNKENQTENLDYYSDEYSRYKKNRDIIVLDTSKGAAAVNNLIFEHLYSSEKTRSLVIKLQDDHLLL
ncbi:MAG: hypothetical protein A2096_11110 [Spirochaetes bacterium GWF1_41_5]|nr:MAG: hypothetical protein A2096_11110 [Spirochaetes bacterium GWF1_41_5]HBE04089.1 hypothetical protein [Spirochaetia bacterium]